MTEAAAEEESTAAEEEAAGAAGTGSAAGAKAGAAEADPELHNVLEVIGAHVATLVGKRRHAALDSAREDEVRCLVALAVLPALAPRIVVAV